jgi:hypothetical protein
MNAILNFTSIGDIRNVGQEEVKEGQYNVVSAGDGTYSAQRIFGVDHSSDTLTIRMGASGRSQSRTFSPLQTVEILRQNPVSIITVN